VNNLTRIVVTKNVARSIRVLFALSLFAVACGGTPDVESTAENGTAAAGEAPAAAPTVEETAAANEDLLQLADDARDVEVLNVHDGSIASLRNAVTGDRPVLIWFWAPH
jgi:hypothetical protein